MKRMPVLVAALIIWLFVFYNIERLSSPFDISRAAYILVPLVAAVNVLIPRLRTVPIWAILVMPIPIFLALKIVDRSSLWGTALPLTVTEISAIALTTMLARGVSLAVSEFENAVTNITIGQVGKQPESFSVGQGEIYREVRRARYYQRPLTLMTIKVEEDSIQVALDRMVQEVQQAMMKQYVLSSVSKMLCDELEDYNIIAKRNDHFLVLLPEATPDKLPDLTRRLRKAVSEQVGVELQIGAAALPEDAITFESLMEKAVREMEAEPATVPAKEHKIYDALPREKTDGLTYNQSA